MVKKRSKKLKEAKKEYKEAHEYLKMKKKRVKKK